MDSSVENDNDKEERVETRVIQAPMVAAPTPAPAVFAAELPPDAVESNMAYVKSLLTQQNRWDRVEADG